MKQHLGTIRNIAIILLIAAVVAFVPGGGRGADVVRAVLSALFAAVIGFIAWRLYKEHRVAIHSLGARRGLFYGAIALGVLAVAGKTRMWERSLTEAIWFVLVGLVVYAFFEVYRFWRSY